MDFKRYNWIFIMLLAAFVVITVEAKVTAEPAKAEVYKIKAAFVYNFLKFAEWPEDKVADSNDTITIGIIGKDHFEEAFKPIKEKKVKDKKIIIKKFPSIDSYKYRYEGSEYKDKYKADYSEQFKKCHLLFMSSSENEHIQEIITFVKSGNVLTAGETAGFLEAGGIINFVIEKNKVRFEINNVAAEKAKLKLRSGLLKLAKRVIKEEKADQREKD